MLDKKILITGGAGFIGYHLINYLLKEDYLIKIIDNYQNLKSTRIPITQVMSLITIIWWPYFLRARRVCWTIID